MPSTKDASIVLAVVTVIIGLLLVSSIGMVAMSGGMMGGMMDGGGFSVNPLWTAFVVLLAVIFLALLAMLLWPWRETAPASTPGTYPNHDPVFPARQSFHGYGGAPMAIDGGTPQSLRAQELTLVKLLDEDERRLYTFIREHGGEMLQKDIVASRAFSKAKVTRLLDRLERKDLVVRERHGMTNKVRLVTMPPRPPEST